MDAVLVNLVKAQRPILGIPTILHELVPIPSQVFDKARLTYPVDGICHTGNVVLVNGSSLLSAPRFGTDAGASRKGIDHA